MIPGTHLVDSADERGGSRCKLAVPTVRKGCRGPIMLHMFLCFLVGSLFVDCTNSFFKPKPKLFCNWESFLI